MTHRYLSTACLHAVEDNRPELHAHCDAMVGFQGVKRPAQCKWCDEHCVCSCHEDKALQVARPGAP